MSWSTSVLEMNTTLSPAQIWVLPRGMISLLSRVIETTIESTGMDLSLIHIYNVFLETTPLWGGFFACWRPCAGILANDG